VAPDQIRSVQVVRLYSSATLFPTPDQRLGRSQACSRRITGTNSVPCENASVTPEPRPSKGEPQTAN
jgi:hypothetical protein